MSGPAFIARRLFLHRRHGRTGRPLFGAALGIALSLIPLVTVDHVADAMIDGIISRYRETSSYHFQIYSGKSADRETWTRVVEDLSRKDAVLSAWVERQGFGLARAGGQREGLTLRALPEKAMEIDPVFARYIEFDEGEWDLEGNSLLLGREAARRLEASIGDEVLVLTAKRSSGGRYIPRVSRLTLRGIFTSGYQDLDRSWAFISDDLGWQILSDESSSTFIGGKHRNYRQDYDSIRDITNSLEDHWTARSWRQINRYLLGNLESTRSILLFIMALIIAVAVFNVLTSMVMLTLERRREIGILKCTGSSPAGVTAAFVMAGSLAALFGTLFGLGGGLLVSYFINPVISGIEAVLAFFSGLLATGPPPSLLNESYYLHEIPIVIRWKALAIIGITTIILSIFASWIPALKAAGQRPLEVLGKH